MFKPRGLFLYLMLIIQARDYKIGLTGSIHSISGGTRVLQAKCENTCFRSTIFISSSPDQKVFDVPTSKTLL